MKKNRITVKIQEGTRPPTIWEIGNMELDDAIRLTLEYLRRKFYAD